MNNKTADVMIHTHQNLNQDQFEEIASQVKNINGVVKFDQVGNRPNLILVAYNASKVRSLTILNKITRLGFNASLVGI